MYRKSLNKSKNIEHIPNGYRTNSFTKSNRSRTRTRTSYPSPNTKRNKFSYSETKGIKVNRNINKFQDKVLNIMGQWGNATKDAEEGRRQVDYSTFKEEVKNNHFDNTYNIINQFSHLDSLSLKRNHDWIVLSQVEEKQTEKKLSREYRWGIQDSNRMVAMVERTQTTRKKLEKIKRT